MRNVQIIHVRQSFQASSPVKSASMFSNGTTISRIFVKFHVVCTSYARRSNKISSSHCQIQAFTSKLFSSSAATLTMTKTNGNRLSWNITSELIEVSTEELITKNRAIFDRVGALKEEDITFERAIQVC